MDDIAQRRLALDCEQSFIVRAPAGSGKTELLIRRFLKLLSVVESPEEIIAITFTHKAAEEMRDRIITALETAAGGEISADPYKKETLQLAQAALQRDHTQAWQLLSNPARLRIQTIDALCGNITRQMPLLSQLVAQNILEAPAPLYLQAAEQTILGLEDQQAWSAAIAELLRHLDNDLPLLKRLLAYMLPRRDQWLRYITVTDSFTRTGLETAISNTIVVHLQAVRARFSHDPEELISLLNHAADHLLQTNPDNPITACHKLSTLPSAEIEALSLWLGIAELLLTKEGKLRKRVTVNQGFPPGKSEKIYKERIDQLLATYTSDPQLVAALAVIPRLPMAYLSDSQWSIIQALAKLLINATAQLNILFARHNKTDFIGIQQSALYGLGDQEQPTDLALQLDYRMQHILVDEFQDVSISQYVLLEKLITAWSDNDGRSIFLVGDPMQSIYRFRQAEVSKFLSTFEDRRIGNIALQALTLTVNFRSQEKIIDWLNHSFAEIFPRHADINSGAVNYTPGSAADDSAQGKVVIHPLLRSEGTNSQQAHIQEADQIIELIKQLGDSSPHDSIAILVLSRAWLVDIITHLNTAGIPFTAVDIEKCSHRMVIRDCLSLTKALLDPADRIAWLSILRAPWCGLSLHDLHQLAGGSRKDSVIWASMNTAEVISGLSEDGRQRLLKMRGILGKALANRERKPLRRLLEMVWIECGGPATLDDPADLKNVQLYFDLLQRHQAASDLHTLSSLEDAVDQLHVVTPPSDHNIQLMTIHKAKGLEFDTVILPGLGRGRRAMQKQLLLWHEQQRRDSNIDLLLAPIPAVGDSDRLYDYLHNLEQIKLDNEQDRLLYVAATRARKQLHLFAVAKITDQQAEPRKNTLLHKLWPVVQSDYQAAAPIPPLVDSLATPQNLIKRHTSTWQLPPSPPSINWLKAPPVAPLVDIEFSWAKETARHIGIVVHRSLQIMVTGQTEIFTEQQVQAGTCWFEQQLKQHGVNADKLHAATQQVQTALLNTIQDSKGRWLFSATHQQAKNEYALSGLCPRTDKIISIKIDRTFIDQHGTRWIIDYKTGHHQGSDPDVFLDSEQQRYQGKLEQYASLMRLKEDRPIKLGLYFPLLQAWRSWHYEG